MHDNNEHCKDVDVYAHFGLAMYCAQVLERTLAVFLSVGLGPDRPASAAELEELMSKHFGRTLGALVRKLRKGVDVSEAQANKLEEALTKRNWLAHRYFWDRAGHFMSPRGREKMIRELRECRDLFQQTYDEFSALTQSWLRHHGLTDDVLAEQERRIIAEADSDPPRADADTPGQY